MACLIVIERIYNCHAVHRSLSSGASLCDGTVGFLPCPILLAKLTYVISSHNWPSEYAHPPSLEWHVWSSSGGNNCHAVHRSLSSGASLCDGTVGFLPYPILSAKLAQAISSHNWPSEYALPPSLEWHVWSSSSGNNCHTVHRSLSSEASLCDGAVWFLPYPILSAKLIFLPYPILSASDIWNYLTVVCKQMINIKQNYLC